jgi:long-subunit acyl-CoA synthetase (AMP-forming)
MLARPRRSSLAVALESNRAIIVSGPSITPRYWRNDEATRERFRDGWFHTGDLGVFDEDGFLRIPKELDAWG